jgi:branched-chain amino acid transport system substrate-binding protein
MLMRSATAFAIVLGLVATALVLGPGTADAQGPIKIGFLAPLTGPFAQIGKDMVTGTEVYLDEVGRQSGGRKIELIVEDSEGNPATALTKARKLVEQDRVHLLTGGLLASTGYALHPYVDSQKIPATYPVMSSDDLTKRVLAKWVVRTGWTSSQPTQPFGDWVAKTLKYKRVATIGMDYAFGWESIGGFQRSFEEAGGQIVQKVWTPLNTTDFAPYLAQMKKDVDGVFAVFLGRLALQFAKQYADVGLKGRMPLIGQGTFTDEHALPSMGDEAIGIVTALQYSPALETPANRKFVKAFEAKAGKVPSYYAETCYTNARWIAEGIQAVKGQVEDREAFLSALRKVEIPDAPRGPIRVDKWGNPIQNIYVRKVERIGGKLQNTVIHTFPGISQFWTYNPDEYLKTPLYVRDYPPCKHC